MWPYGYGFRARAAGALKSPGDASVLGCLALERHRRPKWLRGAALIQLRVCPGNCRRLLGWSFTASLANVRHESRRRNSIAATTAAALASRLIAQGAAIPAHSALAGACGAVRMTAIDVIIFAGILMRHRTSPNLNKHQCSRGDALHRELIVSVSD